MADWRETLKQIAPRIYNMTEFEREGEPLGSGGTATVTAYMHIESKRRMALKEFLFNALDPECSKHLGKFISELSLLLKPSQVAVKCFGVVLNHRSDTNIALAIAMQPCMSLASQVRGDSTASIDTRISWVIQTARCLAHIHDEHNMCHLDVKPSNFLIDTEIKDESANVKISDFGLTVVRDTAAFTKTNTSAGVTYDYTPPEFVSDEKWGKHSDVFSWAIMANEILSCAEPWPDVPRKQIIPNKIYAGKRPILFQHGGVPEIFAELITQCWANDSSSRPNMADVYKQLQSAVGGSHGIQQAREATMEHRNKYASITPIPLPDDVKEMMQLIDVGNHMRELKLPWAEQTHELLFEELTKLIFVTQLTESVLLAIRTDDDGNLTNDVRAWGIGSRPSKKTAKQLFGGRNEVHNISLADEDGFLWISLQIPNMILKVDARDFLKDGPIEPCQVIELPDLLDGTGSQQAMVPRNMGSPHVARHNQRTGRVWVGLKGRSATRPGQEIRSLDCDCCDRKVHFDNYREVFGADAATYFQKLPSEDAYAIWAGHRWS